MIKAAVPLNQASQAIEAPPAFAGVDALAERLSSQKIRLAKIENTV
jgi:hypothetical protein